MDIYPSPNKFVLLNVSNSYKYVQVWFIDNNLSQIKQANVINELCKLIRTELYERKREFQFSTNFTITI